MQKLPENLKSKILSFERKLLLTESLISISTIIIAILIPFFLLFTSDRFFDTPKQIRLILFISGIFIAAISIRIWLLNWILKRRSYAQIAIIIQKKFKKIGDKLQSAVELSYEENSNKFQSEQLRSAALQQIAEETKNLNFSKAINRAKTAKFAIISICLITILLILAKFATPAIKNSFDRFFRPFANTPRFTFVLPDNIPERIVVPSGENFELKFALSPNSLKQPRKAAIVINGHKSHAPLAAGAYKFTINGISSDSTLFLKIGDWHKEIKINALYRPAPTKIEAEIIYPDYIGKIDKKVIPASLIRALEGSKIRLSGNYSRPLSEIKALFDSQNIPIKLNQEKFEFENELLPKNNSNILLSATDTYSLEQKPQSILKFELYPDNQPYAEISGAPRTSAILKDEVIELSLYAYDDFALKYASPQIEIFKKDGDWKSERKFRKEFTFSQKNPSTEFRKAFFISPSAESVQPGKLIVIKLAANDFLKDRQEVFSNEIFVYVLSDEEHFSLLAEKFREIANKIMNLRNSENENTDSTKNINKYDNQKISEADSEISKLSQNEEINRVFSETICKDIAQSLKEALKNNYFSPETAARWTDILSKLYKLSTNDFKKSCKALKEAESKQDRKNKLNQASEIQDEIVKKLDEIMKESEDTIAEAFSANFAARLRKEAENEKKLQIQLQDTLKISAGLSVEDAPAEILDLINKHKNSHYEITKEILDIKSDISAVFKRLPLQAYQIILNDMENQKIQKILTENQNLISNNKLYEAGLKCKDIESKLNEWAELLENSSKNKNSSSCDFSIQVPKELIASLMKALLKETQLRKKTKELNGKNLEKESMQKESLKLSIEQDSIRNILSEMKDKYAEKIQNLSASLNRIGKPMTDASVLLSEANTGEDTIGAETEAIELLAKMLSGMSQQSPATAMMANAIAGNNPGFGISAESDTANTSNNRENLSLNKIERNIEKNFLSSEFNLPEQFKTFYQLYIKKIKD